MEEFFIKQNDRRKYLVVTLVNFDEEGGVIGPQDLTDADSVVFSMREKETGEIKVNRGPVVIDDAEAGEVHYEWQEGDTDTSGKYLGEFEVMFGVKPQTFPNNKVGFKITITDDIG
jgi:hypothetical protein